MSKENITVYPIETLYPQELNPISVQIRQRLTSSFTGSTLLFGRTEANEKVVIKTSAYPEGNANEWEGLKKISSTGLPTQQGIMIGKLSDGSSGLVTKEVEGEPLTDIPSEDQRRDIGTQLKNIHSSTKISGDEWEKSGKQTFTYYDWHLAYWRKNADTVSPICRQAISILDTLVEAASRYFQSTTPVFTHQDLHDGQVIVNSNNDKILIDFENWKEADPLDDIAMYLFHSIRENSPKAFYSELSNGYFDGRKTTDQENSVLAFDTLFFALRAVGYFHKFKLPYFNTAIDNLRLVNHYIDKENTWK
jgi:aminoglycoside phosphotransferase (APT) family kinase protein